MRPVIGIPCNGEYGDTAAAPVRYTLSRSYVAGIQRAGGAVLLIPSSTDPEVLRPIYAGLAGLLLSGGGDIQPALFHRPVTAELASVDPERDAAELLLARWAVEDDLPLFAICRGIQTLNVALGGTLIQDIPSQVPGALVHSPMPKPPRERPQHPVDLVRGSRLAAILGDAARSGRIEVNSFHHQAAEEVPASLQVAARAPDGVIEALEAPERSFVLGVQWHPEEMAAIYPAQQALFDAFIGACRARKARS